MAQRGRARSRGSTCRCSRSTPRELADPRYLGNPTDRCYFCKAELWTRLGEVARERGFDTIIDGTNADDLGEHRPGMRAAEEHRVRSPLAELGWSKAAVRGASRSLGLPTWDAPAAPCLSSRVVYGLEITPAASARSRTARRSFADLASPAICASATMATVRASRWSPADAQRVRDEWDAVDAFFSALGFAAVELDPAGYRRGGLLALAPRSTA